MNKGLHIKTHFDIKILLFFVILFIVSCVMLAFQINTKADCSVSAFKVDAPSYKAGELMTFSDVSKNSYEWRWYFGDGTDISYRSKVMHAFSRPGKYTVKLLVNNSCSVEKTITILPKEDILDAALLPKFYAPKIAHVGDAIKFRDSTENAKSWEWRFEDGLKVEAIEKAPTYVYKLPGEKVVSLVINGDTKHVQFAKITVLPAKKSEKDMVIERLKRRNSTRVDPVEEYFSQVPDAPKRRAEIPDINDSKLNALLLGVAQNKLTYDNLIKYFCTDGLPLVELKGGELISLQTLDTKIRKRQIRIREVTITKDKDNCVKLIKLDFKFRNLF